MHIEFDPAKDASNLAKHSVSLAVAGELDWETALVWVDDRFDYIETRMIEAKCEESLACAAPIVVR